MATKRRVKEPQKARVKAKTTPRAKPRHAASAKSRRSGARPAVERDAGRALDALMLALDGTRTRITSVTAALDRLAGSAVDAHVAALAAALVKDNLVRDLDLFAQQLTSDQPITQQQQISIVRLHHSLLAWLQDHLQLEPDREPGKNIDVPVSRLEQFQVDGDTSSLPSGIVTLRIEARGWKRKGTTLSRPLVSVVSSS